MKGGQGRGDQFPLLKLTSLGLENQWASNECIGIYTGLCPECSCRVSVWKLEIYTTDRQPGSTCFIQCTGCTWPRVKSIALCNGIVIYTTVCQKSGCSSAQYIRMHRTCCGKRSCIASEFVFTLLKLSGVMEVCMHQPFGWVPLLYIEMYGLANQR